MTNVAGARWIARERMAGNAKAQDSQPVVIVMPRNSFDRSKAGATCTLIDLITPETLMRIQKFRNTLPVHSAR